MKKKMKKNFKMPKGTKTGMKRVRGAPILYKELKEKLNLSLTPTVIAKLKQAAQDENISTSELVERWVRSWEEPQPGSTESTDSVDSANL